MVPGQYVLPTYSSCSLTLIFETDKDVYKRQVLLCVNGVVNDSVNIGVNTGNVLDNIETGTQFLGVYIVAFCFRRYVVLLFLSF